MKKIILYSMLSAVSIVLIGCGSTASSKALREVNSQLDRVENSLEQVSQQDLTSLCRYNDYDRTYTSAPIYSNTYNLLNLRNKVSNDVAMQDRLDSELKSKIENVRGLIKNNKTKFNNNQIKALQSLAIQLGSNANRLKGSKTDVSDGLRAINYSQNTNHFSLDQLGSGYNTVSNALEMRKACYFNLANTLSQIESIVSGKKEYLSAPSYPTDNQTPQQDTSKSSEDKNQDKIRNINIPNPTTDDEESETDKEKAAPAPRVAYNYPRGYGYNPYYNGPYGYGGYNRMGYGGYGYNGIGYGGYGYGGYGGYGYNPAFNPTRNTDTYRPYNINIDTYRWTKRGTLPNGEYEVQVISTKPIKVEEEEQQPQDSAQPDAEKQEGAEAKQESNIEKLFNQNKKMLHGSN